MEAMARTVAGKELVSEIFTKINNAKDKPKKIEVLRQYDSPNLRMILKGAFDPNIKWEFYLKATHLTLLMRRQLVTEHTYLEVEFKEII